MVAPGRIARGGHSRCYRCCCCQGSPVDRVAIVPMAIVLLGTMTAVASPRGET